MPKCKCGHERSDHTEDMGICLRTDPKKPDGIVAQAEALKLSKEKQEERFGFNYCGCHTYTAA